MAESNAVDILQTDFLTPFRDLARQAIGEIIDSVPELRTNDQWWKDIEEYNQTNPYGNIIDTAGRTPNVNNFDHNGAAKWLMRMYVQPDTVLLNPYLLNYQSAVQVVGCAPQEYSRALAAYMDLRNNFLGHGGADAETMTFYDLLCHASLVIWMTAHLNCSAQQATLQAMRASRDNIAAQCGMQNPAEYATAEAERQLMYNTLDWARQRQEARAAARAPRRDRNALPFEQWPVAEPILIAPWEPVFPEQTIFPSELRKGRELPRSYTPYMPCPPNVAPGPEVEKEEPNLVRLKKKHAQAKNTPDVQVSDDDILYKILHKVVFALSWLYTFLYYLFTFWIPRSRTKKWVWDDAHSYAYRQILQGAVYDMRAGTDKPYTALTLIIYIVALVLSSNSFFLFNGLGQILFYLNGFIGWWRLFLTYKSGKAGYKMYVESNVLEPGVAPQVFIYYHTVAKPIEKVFYVFAWMLAIGVASAFPFFARPGLAFAMGVLITLFGKDVEYPNG